MTVVQKSIAAVLLVLLGLAAYGAWTTNQPARRAATPGSLAQPADPLTGIDENAFILAQRLSPLADGAEEQGYAQTALRLADHELDEAFTGALRRIEAHPPTLSPAAQLIQARLDKSQKMLQADQARVAQLTAAVAQAGSAPHDALQDQLDLAASQLDLDKDEVEEAGHDLIEAGGNLHQRIQMMMDQHAAAEHAKPIAAPVVALAGAKGLIGDVRLYLALRDKHAWLEYAGRRGAQSEARLAERRRELARELDTNKAAIPELAGHTKHGKDASSSAGGGSGPAPAASTPADPAALLASTRQISVEQRILTLLDERILDLQQLREVYSKWSASAAAQTLLVLHGILIDVALVLGIILVLLFVDHSLERLLGRTRLDRRQVETLRSVTRVSLQLLGVVVILLIVIGIPSQLGTMIGLAGAGLTVALKDFIVAFIGWLVLMGRNGVRLGDWVEINGVSGEVVETGMFHTVLLETGNWTDPGHPTGRRVTFTNSFAIERHYFNFSTSGQWLWDELLVLVPFDKDPNLIAEAILREVVTATEAGAAEAERELRRMVPGRRAATVTAAPAVSVKPAAGGVEVSVRYLTKASDRFQLRARLFQSAVRMLSAGQSAA